eukprot:TRINITY_DN10640_c0_g1_i2.p1 TRINITY_DN10640_c0_g1~~TRINITY_DN10640_c0_g1_i2.p1  ORF type:complete len:149 (-),score=23.14 TRINITY_DN10640_c0_g1_i2:159-605(-)
MIKRLLQEQGPFDGIIGFSQGGLFSALLCGMLMEESPGLRLPFGFAMFFSAFTSPLPSLKHYYDKIRSITDQDSYELLTLHGWGAADDLVHPEMSEKLYETFPHHDSKTFRLIHPGGHYVPTSSASKPIIRDFLKKFAATKISKEANS